MSTTTLKLIALALMFLDHIHEFIPGAPLILTILGRISAPVFFFYTVWGFHHTHSRPVYLLRMYLCSALMGILDSVLNAAIPDSYQSCTNNIFSTLFVICLFIYLWEKGTTPGKKALMEAAWAAVNLTVLAVSRTLLSSAWLEAAAEETLGWDFIALHTTVTGLLPNAITCEGGLLAVVMGLVLHFCKGSKAGLSWGYGLYCAAYLAMLLSAGAQAGVADWGRYLFRNAIQWMQILALPLMLTYNGQRGRNLKYLFYVFYPLHIALLFLLGNVLW